MTGIIAALALYTGESAGAVTGVHSAVDVVRELVDGAERLSLIWPGCSARV